jgi:hypothetical protein
MKKKSVKNKSNPKLPLRFVIGLFLLVLLIILLGIIMLNSFLSNNNFSGNSGELGSAKIAQAIAAATSNPSPSPTASASPSSSSVPNPSIPPIKTIITSCYKNKNTCSDNLGGRSFIDINDACLDISNNQDGVRMNGAGYTYICKGGTDTNIIRKYNCVDLSTDPTKIDSRCVGSSYLCGKGPNDLPMECLNGECIISKNNPTTSCKIDNNGAVTITQSGGTTCTYYPQCTNYIKDGQDSQKLYSSITILSCDKNKNVNSENKNCAEPNPYCSYDKNWIPHCTQDLGST